MQQNNSMISARDLEPLRTASPYYKSTEQLKRDLACARQQRRQFYLTEGEFDRILHWKLENQYRRGRERRATNTPEVIRTVTEAVFGIDHPDPEYLLKLRFGLLCTMRGVGVPIASAVLALVYPEEYCVIDFRSWRQVFGEEKRAFSIADYNRYLAAVQPLAAELGWPVQEVDLAIWEYDSRQPRNAKKRKADKISIA